MAFTRSMLETAQLHPDRVAITDAGNHSYTYQELVSGAPTVAGLMNELIAEQQARGAHFTAPEELQGVPVIALCLETAVDTAALIAMLAGYRLVSLTLDPKWPLEHRLTSLHHSGASVLITDEHEFVAALHGSGWAGTTLTPHELRQRAVHADAGPPGVRDGAEPFLLIFTSGTTDDPKAFIRTRASWRYNVTVSTRYLHAAPATVTLAPGPLAYSLTLYGLVEVLATGGTLVLQNRFDPIAAAQILRDEPVSRLVCVPAILPALTLAASRYSTVFSRLEAVISGGAFLSRDTRQRFAHTAPNATIVSYYGAAEIGFIGYSTRGEDTSLTLFAGVELEVRDEYGDRLPAGETGTLYVRVPSQGDRYISTTGGQRITGADGWATVHDLGSLERGELTLAGRSGDIANIGGHNVSLVQVERALHESLGGEHASVVAVPHKQLGQILVAVLETSTAVPLDKARLLSELRQKLPPQFLPQRFVTTPELPRTVGGKLRRVQTRENVLQGVYPRLDTP